MSRRKALIMWRDKPKAELVKENDRSVTTVAERRLVVHKRRAQPVASVHGCCLLVGGMSWSGPQMRSPRLRLLPIVERLACERARKEPRSHTVGEVVGARPDNATAVVFRACTSCRSVSSVYITFRSRMQVRYEFRWSCTFRPRNGCSEGES